MLLKYLIPEIMFFDYVKFCFTYIFIHYIGRDCLTLSQSLKPRLSWSRSLIKSTMGVSASEDPIFYLNKGKGAADHGWP